VHDLGQTAGFLNAQVVHFGGTVLAHPVGAKNDNSSDQVDNRVTFLNTWVILPNLVHTRNLQFLAIFHNLAGNEHGFWPKLVKHQ